MSDAGSAVAYHSQYLHYVCLAALRADGVPSFSFAFDPTFAVNYVPGAKPPSPPSEWRPLEFSWGAHGRFYDHFLVRGPHDAQRLFGAHADEVELAGESGNWAIFRRK